MHDEEAWEHAGKLSRAQFEQSIQGLHEVLSDLGASSVAYQPDGDSVKQEPYGRLRRPGTLTAAFEQEGDYVGSLAFHSPEWGIHGPKGARTPAPLHPDALAVVTETSSNATYHVADADRREKMLKEGATVAESFPTYVERGNLFERKPGLADALVKPLDMAPTRHAGTISASQGYINTYARAYPPDWAERELMDLDEVESFVQDAKYLMGSDAVGHQMALRADSPGSFPHSLIPGAMDAREPHPQEGWRVRPLVLPSYEQQAQKLGPQFKYREYFPLEGHGQN